MSVPAPPDGAALATALARFHALDADGGGDAYLEGKTALTAGHRELAQLWGKVRRHLPAPGVALDFGCRHGVFAFLARQEFGAAPCLHGCDTFGAGHYAAMHAAAGLNYAAVGHPWLLPYPDDAFHLVLAGGTLEHVANDGATLAELWRVLVPGGRLLLSHLPNAASASEWWSRRFAPAQAHPRRYRLPALRERLLQLGFLPVAWGRHQLLPATLPGAAQRPRLARALDRAFALNAPLEKLWPLNRLSATLWLVAEKRMGF
jgi:SAM-dependent methyltransferase